MDQPTKESKIDDGTLVPISFIWKVLGACVVLVPIVWWGAKVDSQTSAIPSMKEKLDQISEDVAVLKDNITHHEPNISSISKGPRLND